ISAFAEESISGQSHKRDELQQSLHCQHVQLCRLHHGSLPVEPGLSRQMEQLDLHSVLVTGSNRGLGLELVKQLAGKSNPPKWIFAICQVPAGSGAQMRPEDLKNLAAEHPQIVIIALDTNDPRSVKAAAAKVTELLKGAGLNLLVNNAGILKLSTVETETPENMSEVYKTNVIGPMIVSQAFLPLLRKASQKSPQKGMSCSKAAILNITSECGSMTNLFAWHMNELISYRCSKIKKCVKMADPSGEISYRYAAYDFKKYLI
ncbi:hypothetical protein L345_13963, partial [Ophiophagus hannah]